MKITINQPHNYCDWPKGHKVSDPVLEIPYGYRGFFVCHDHLVKLIKELIKMEKNQKAWYPPLWMSLNIPRN